MKKLCMVLVLMLVCSVSSAAFAQSGVKLDVSKGSITLSVNSEGKPCYFQENVTESATPYTGSVTLTGSTDRRGTTLTISEGTHYVTLSDVSITKKSSGPTYAAVTIESGAQLYLTLDGNNLLECIKHCAIHCPDGAQLVIDGGNDDYLTANGAYRAAGIGSNGSDAAGKITINGGNVTATGGANGGAGIGGGVGGNGGTITINGGNVTATGGKENIPGIGAGLDGTGAVIKINRNAVVNATVVEGTVTYFGGNDVPATASASAPKTGDNANLALWMCLLALSAAGFVMLKQRRQHG